MRKRITIDVEEELLEQLDEAAAAIEKSRNQCIVDAVSSHLRALEREKVDKAFLAMGSDPEYLAEMQHLEAELAPLSDEAWQVMERQERRGDS